MPESPTITRKFLSDAGGWKEMKQARMLHSAGKVLEASYRNGILEGIVKDGKTYKVRMEIRSLTDIENHCQCFRARRDGIICAHGLAVGLEVIEPTKTPTPAPSTNQSGKKEDPTLSLDWPAITEANSEDAIPATLHLVIPPNLATAWDKNRITVGVEVECGEDRKLLSAVASATKLFLDAGDATLFRTLQELMPETVPGIAILSSDDFCRLLSAIPGHSGTTLGKAQALRISHLPWRPSLKRTSGLRFRPDWDESVVPLITGNGAWVLSQPDLIQPVAPGLPSRLQGALVAGVTLEPHRFAEEFAQLQGHFDLEDVEIYRPTPAVLLNLEGSLNHLDANLSFDYEDISIPASETRDSVWERHGILFLSDNTRENAAIADLESAGFLRRGSNGHFVLKNKDAILQFLAHGYPAFRTRWQTSVGERFEHALTQIEPIETSLNFRSGGEDWFAMDVGFSTTSGDTISRQEIERLLQMGQPGKKLANGKTAVLNMNLAESFGDILTDCDPEQIQAGTYRIDQSQAGYLKETSIDCGFQTKGTVPWKTTVEGLEFYDLSKSLSDTLRPYQLDGVKWMQGLASRGMGGILADDMGLGKTLQTLSFIYSVGGSALVVCPSSLVYNWISEAAKFVPELKVVAIEGPNREKTLNEHGDADILVTSYALLRRDEASYREREFDVIILDEAQHIKNPESQVSQIAHQIKGSHRFALTGTPIENSIRDLWSITQFALPGYLGNRKQFKERFEKPLTSSEPMTGVKDRLHRRLRPVIMRRLKNEVAQDLPEKIEQIVYCDLKPSQEEVYEKLLSKSKQSILDAEGGHQRMLALTALLRLRQTCCDLRLLGLPNISEENASIKADALHELLDTAIEGGHRVLVFSQFVEMLQLLVPPLTEKQIDFCYLDGQTKNRGEVVNRFQENEIPVFLISLKAGGVGLNLTGADVVIHVDPWWNPAVEAQATDRAHRIGQKNVVTSYKLITRNTVEEKILSLQNKKREIMESLLGEAGDTHLSEAELMSLFE